MQPSGEVVYIVRGDDMHNLVEAYLILVFLSSEKQQKKEREKIHIRNKRVTASVHTESHT